MKMIRAIIRPELEYQVIHALERIGEYAMTKIPVTGRGRQGGVEASSSHYAELAKVMMMLVVPDERVDAVVTTLAHAAYTGFPGDGRIFISDVEKTVRLRTGEMESSANELGSGR
jgi:nitrogen regulatory protein PII 1